MSHRSFDQALESTTIDVSDIEFDLGGKTWHLGTIPDFLLLQWINSASAGVVRQADEMTKIIQHLVIETEKAEWMDYIHNGRTETVPAPPVETMSAPDDGDDDEVVDVTPAPPSKKFYGPPTTKVFVQLIQWAIEQHGERRPTPPSSV